MNNKTLESVWGNFLSFIKDNVLETGFDTWFKPIKPLGLDLSEKELTIQVPTHFFVEFLEENYISLIKTGLVKELGEGVKLKYRVCQQESSSCDSDPETITIRGNQTKIKRGGVCCPEPPQEPINPFVIPGIQKVDSQLNINYNFQNFVEGDSNRLARSAGEAVSNNPGRTSFNPLLIYGGVGLGKTHLAQAIGIDIKEKHPEKTVLYVSAEKFIQQYASSAINNKRNDFIHFYQMIDILIVDDVQFLSGKNKAKTQDVFFHILHLLICKILSKDYYLVLNGGFRLNYKNLIMK